MYTRDTPIAGKTSITAGQALLWAQSVGAKGNYIGYITELWHRAPRYNLNPLVVLGQWADETDKGRSPRWLEGDPAGIGIFADDTPSTLPEGLTGLQSARIHIAELILKVTRRVSADLEEVWGYDPHLHRVTTFVNRPDWPTIRTLHDLRIPLAGGDFTWAANQSYGDQIADHMNAIEAFVTSEERPSMELLIGRSSAPPITDDIVNKAEGLGWADYGPRQLRALALHRVVGAARYTSGHFRNLSDPHGRLALTDWGICGTLDGDMDGVILRWNDPDGRRSPWASGPLFSTTGALLANGDALDFYRRYVLGDPFGANVINRDTEAIELSGQYNTPISRAQWNSLIRLSAWRLDVKMRLPWTKWPKNHDGVQAVLFHGEVNGWSKPCPGMVVIDSIDAYINDVGEWLRSLQERAEQPVPTPAPEPAPRPEGPRLTDKMLAEWFGELQLDDRRLRYNKRGPISELWRRRGRATGVFPAITDADLLADGSLLVRFADGWTVVDPKGPVGPAPIGQRA